MIRLQLDIPHSIKVLLNELSNAIGSKYQVTLAGGFLRDTYGGAPIKDIDILVSPMNEGVAVNPSEIRNMIDSAAIRHWVNVQNTTDTNYMQGMKDRGVEYLMAGTCPVRDNQELQLVIYGHPMSRKDLARDMDMNICQIACGPDLDVIASEEFLEGFQKKHITILNGQKDAREIERVQRMQRKYPEFTADTPVFAEGWHVTH